MKYVQRVDGKVNLAKFDTGSHKGMLQDDAVKETSRLGKELEELQELMFAAGFMKCGVLETFEASARNSRLNRSLIGKRRNSPRSRFTAPGPRSRLRPALPYRTPTGAANAVGSKNGCPVPIPPNWATVGLIWSAVCVFPGAFSAP